MNPISVSLYSFDSLSAELLLQLFLSAWPTTVTMNAHSLCHLTAYARNLGPLYTFWAFPFENALGGIKIFSHGKRTVETQLAFGAVVQESLPMLVNACKPREQSFNMKEKQVLEHT
jgi:hypothetical protein